MFDIFSPERYREFSDDSGAVDPDNYEIEAITQDGTEKWSRKFLAFKFVVDKLAAILSLPLVVLIGIGLVLANPFFNPGPLLFSQMRMGKDGRRFRMWKFRTMTEGEDRDATDQLEEGRITPLGGFMRKTRIDELPNFWSVFLGHMSLVGPRPDDVKHARHYNDCVAGYRERYRIRPGITGLAQVRMGYVDSEADTRLKTMYDNIYATKGCGRLDIYILRKTFGVVLGRQGR